MKKRVLLTIIVVGLVLVAIVAGVQLAFIGPRDAVNAEAFYTGVIQNGTELGAADAPVVVEEYFDFRCPHCQVASEEIVRPVVEKYVRSGQVRFVYRVFPILGPPSVNAAIGAVCAANQNKFWPYHEVLFQKADSHADSAFTAKNLARYARDTGLNSADFERCLESADAAQSVRRQYESGVQLGLRGTPSFTVNGTVVDVPTREAVEKAIEGALEEHRG